MTIAHRAIKALLAAAALAAIWVTPAHAEQRKSILERYTSQAAFESAYAALGANHYRVVDVDLCFDGSLTRWWTIVYQYDPAFTPNGNDALVWTAPSLPSLRTIALALEAGETKIDDIDASAPVFGERGPSFVALHNTAPGRQAILAQFLWAAFMADLANEDGENRQLIDIDIYPFSQGPDYFGVTREGAPRATMVRATTWPAFEAERVAREGQGLRLRDIAARHGEFIGIYNPGSGPQTAGYFDDWGALRERFAEVDNNGIGTMRLQDVECFASGGAARYVAVWSAIPGRVRPQPEVGPRPAPPPRPRSPRRPSTPPVDRSPG